MTWDERMEINWKMARKKKNGWDGWVKVDALIIIPKLGAHFITSSSHLIELSPLLSSHYSHLISSSYLHLILCLDDHLHVHHRIQYSHVIVSHRDFSLPLLLSSLLLSIMHISFLFPLLRTRSELRFSSQSLSSIHLLLNEVHDKHNKPKKDIPSTQNIQSTENTTRETVVYETRRWNNARNMREKKRMRSVCCIIFASQNTSR